MRIGLGCMRLSTEPERDEATGLATLAAALDAGVVLFDTARAYATDEADLGHNERLLSRAWRARVTPPAAHVVTKCGMSRAGGAWIPDGRAKRIADDLAGSLDALAGVPIDRLLLHAPDPHVSLATSGRALARAVEQGLVRGVGASNVSRKQLDELAAHAPISAVEIALGAYDDLAVRSGVVAFCLERSIEVLAHAPLGGPERAKKLERDPILAAVAARHEAVGAAEVFLAYLLSVRPGIVPIVGARRPETVLRFAAAESLTLDESDLDAMDARFPTLAELRRPRSVAARAGNAEVVLLMGVQGAGKSRAAEAFVARGYERLNRDAVGGTLRAITKTLEERLRAGAERVVLDNTYVTRAARSDVVRVAAAQGARVRCVFFETPLPEAQVNIVLRMLERFGRVVEPEEMATLGRTDPAALAPHAVSRMARDLEPPTLDEGFAQVEVVPFERDVHGDGRAGIAVAVDALDELEGEQLEAALAEVHAHRPVDAPCLLFAWRPDSDPASLASSRSVAAIREALGDGGAPVEVAMCPHPAGPPICWCRPPLPALFLAFAHRHGLKLRASTLFGRSGSDRRVARVLGMSFVAIGEVNPRPSRP
jgi:aryl-alcohol dehydrogenase-like predicted oxidoreductase